jgi:hypothetical protein
LAKILPSKDNAEKLLTGKYYEDDNDRLVKGIKWRRMPIEKDRHFRFRDITWVHRYNKGPSNKLLKDPLLFSITGYFGNEAGYETVYAKCALVVEFPRSDSRAKVDIVEALLKEPIVADAVKTIPSGVW